MTDSASPYLGFIASISFGGAGTTLGVGHPIETALATGALLLMLGLFLVWVIGPVVAYVGGDQTDA